MSEVNVAVFNKDTLEEIGECIMESEVNQCGHSTCTDDALDSGFCLSHEEGFSELINDTTDLIAAMRALHSKGI